ncbi:phosphotransferase family protein [Actinopolymorpha alba]|uniref:phosphotransferase family protein n=1 Tax=Actinopolymorpha alba TaxID=533267 RepID=UPI0003633647|nr:phosphotransferase [Actinopolymorpha alba]
MIAQVTALRDEPRVQDALEELPRTLLHGDVHRNNVLVDEHGNGRLIDWGGALVGIPALDIVNLGPPGSNAYRTYADTWETLTGQNLETAAWRRSYLVATVCINLKYVAFAAKIFGDHKAQSMLQQATEALEQIGSDPKS